MLNETAINKSRKIKRGDVFFVESPYDNPKGSEMWGDRPALVISNNIGNKYSTIVQIVYLSTQHNKKVKLPTHVELKSVEGYPIALCEQITTVSKDRLKSFLTRVSDNEMENVNQALCISLEIPNTTRPTGLFKKWECYFNKYKLEY